MKKIGKFIWLIITIGLVVFANTNTTNIQSIFNPYIQTAITEISWEEKEYTFLGDGYTFFDFTIDYQIYNSKDVNITFDLPYCNLAFLPNITAEIENPDMHQFFLGFIGLCAIGNVTVVPGISPASTIYTLAIDEEGLTVLPDGKYTAWIWLHGDNQITSNETVISIVDGEAYIDLTPPTSVTVGYSFLGIMLGCNILISSLIILRRRK